MPTETGSLTDILSSMQFDIGQLSTDVADFIDGYLDKVSTSLRYTLSSSPWLPPKMRPQSLPTCRRPPVKTVPLSYPRRILEWISKNKVWTGIFVVTLSGATYYIVKRKISRKKRKALRAKDGSRLEVVVIAGQPGEPFTRSVSLDLERRGYIVFILCSTSEEERLVQNESRPDIKPLSIDIRNSINTKKSIERFAGFLQSPHAAFPGAKLHYYTMRSLIVIPTTQFPTIPIATLALVTLSDLVNTRLLQPIIMIQSFLPLFQLLPFSHGKPRSSDLLDLKPSIVILTPTIISSINPAFHLPEASITSALSSFSNVLEQELAPLSIPVTHVQLGNFDTSGFSPHHRQLTIQSQRAETLQWDENTRINYGLNYAVSTTGKWGYQSNLRVLNKAVLDAMYNRQGGTMRVGSGSVVYGFVGKWVPRSIVAWMMGLRKVECAAPTVSAGTDESKLCTSTNMPESKFLYGQKDEEAFGDAGVWSLGFESKIGNDEFGS